MSTHLSHSHLLITDDPKCGKINREINKIKMFIRARYSQLIIRRRHSWVVFDHKSRILIGSPSKLPPCGRRKKTSQKRAS